MMEGKSLRLKGKNILNTIVVFKQIDFRLLWYDSTYGRTVEFPKMSIKSHITVWKTMSNDMNEQWWIQDFPEGGEPNQERH